MSGPGYSGQASPQGYGGQQWGGRPSSGYPPAGPQGQGQWQGGQGGAPNWNGAQGGPQGWNGGLGGMPPGGMPPQEQGQGGSRGPGVGIIIAISVLVLALIGVLVWVFFFKGDDGGTAEPGASSSSVQTPQETEKPGGEDTPGGDQPGGDEPGGQQPGGQQPGGDQPGGQQPGGQQPGGQQPGGQQPGTDPGGLDEFVALLPKQIGDWQLSAFGLTMYSKGTTAIVVFDFQQDRTVRDEARRTLQNVEEFEGGFCGTMDGGDEKTEMCHIHPGKKPNNSIVITSTDASRADLVEVSKGIVAYK